MTLAAKKPAMSTKRLRDKSMLELRRELENIEFSLIHDDWQQPALARERRKASAIRKELGRRWAIARDAN